MKYALIEINGTSRTVSTEISGWNQPYKALFDKTDVSGSDVFILYSHNNFNNEFQKTDEQLYKERGWFGEIFHDKVEHREPEKDETPPGEGFVPVIYIAHAGSPNEFRQNGWFPKNGFCLPVPDNKTGYRFFKEGTLIPEKVVPFDQRETAEKTFAELNLPYEQISGFYRLESYKNNDRFVGRNFDPDLGDYGRFNVDANWLPDYSGLDRVGSRSADEQKIVMEASVPVQESVKTKQK